jgi:hypothetical protein
MATDKKVFHPYKGQPGSVAGGCNEEFAIELVKENLDRGNRLVLTPKGAEVFIWLIEAESGFIWQIYFPDGDELIKLSYTGLESYWGQCDEDRRAHRKSFDPLALFEAPHPVWAW